VLQARADRITSLSDKDAATELLNINALYSLVEGRFAKKVCSFQFPFGISSTLLTMSRCTVPSACAIDAPTVESHVLQRPCERAGTSPEPIMATERSEQMERLHSMEVDGPILYDRNTNRAAVKMYIYSGYPTETA
jgi:hypothetical protein